MVSLTFHFFPLYKVRFNDFISLLFDLSKTIRSLIFPDLNSSTTDLNGSLNFACLQNKATSDKTGGKPNHFQVYLFILAYIYSTVFNFVYK